MKREQQDLIWACLPKEERAIQREAYKSSNDVYDDVANELRNFLFGHHNLTSDTESEDMLCINKENFDNFYKLLEHCYNHDSSLYDDLYWKFVECLPDKLDVKEHSTSKEIADLIGMKYDGSLVPKFRKRDKVRFKNSYYKEEMHGKIGRIYNISTEAECYVEVDNTIYWVKESDIEPYIEEKELNRQSLYNALCELESSSIKVRKSLISIQDEK